MKKASIKDIAEKMGVSTATVSLVLHGKEPKGRVGEQLANKIRETAKEMDYHPNGLARSLRMGHSRSIGLIVADISNPFFGMLATHVQKEAELCGYTVLIANTNESDEKMYKIVDILKSRQVEGFIIVPTENGKEFLCNLAEGKTPVVLVDRYYPDSRISHVVVDNYAAAYEATSFLISKGCKRIALFVYKSNLSNMLERKQGCIDALMKHTAFYPELVCEVNYANIQFDICACMDAIFNNGEVDGIFFSTNNIALMGVKSLIKRDEGLLDKIDLVCFDSNEAFDFMNISIPYISQPVAKMGKKSVSILLEKLGSKDVDDETIECKLYGHLVVDKMNDRVNY